MNLFGSCEKLPKDPRGNILVKYLSRMWYLWAKNMKAGLCKLKFCTEAKQTLLFQRLQNNFFNSGPLHGANISQIFPFTKTREQTNIRPKYLKHILPPACKNLYWLLSCWCLFSTCPQIYIKSESYFPNISL